jgi:hypothetical protein
MVLSKAEEIMSILDILKNADGVSYSSTTYTVEYIPHCVPHFNFIPCAQCAEDDRRGYAVLMLAGRCANGAERDHGSLWHAVRDGEAVCGATPGRRSVGWSTYTKLGKAATCPRCVKKLQKRGKA